MDWTKAVTHPLGLVAFILALVFGVLGYKFRGRERPWFLPTALFIAAIALVGCLYLAYRQTVTESALPIPTMVYQETHGAGSPAVQNIKGDITYTYGASNSQSAPSAAKPSKQPTTAPSTPDGRVSTSTRRQSEPSQRIGKIRSVIKDTEGDDFKVVLGADSPIKIPGPPGLLRVWIGNKNYNPDIPKTMAQASSSIPALGTTAKVTPIAPAFEIDPQDSICVQIDPTGTDTFFKIKPKDKGTYEVGAQVFLYKSTDCIGTPIPKATTTLKVTVDVDDKKIQDDRKKKIGEVFWEKVMKFWGELLALISALILFLLRRHLKKWFGFGESG